MMKLYDEKNRKFLSNWVAEMEEGKTRDLVVQYYESSKMYRAFFVTEDCDNDALILADDISVYFGDTIQLTKRNASLITRYDDIVSQYCQSQYEDWVLYNKENIHFYESMNDAINAWYEENKITDAVRVVIDLEKVDRIVRHRVKDWRGFYVWDQNLDKPKNNC